jgi:putative transposase
VRERRDQLKHPQYSKPELLAQKPNEVWTWDITELRGPVKYARYYLYVILDLFSRYVTGWMVAEVQSHDLAQHLIEQAVQREGVGASQLTLHSDRGATMLAKPLGLMLSDLGILKSHSRPGISREGSTQNQPFSFSRCLAMTRACYEQPGTNRITGSNRTRPRSLKTSQTLTVFSLVR